jgi:phosphoglycerol transferase MdoB-like AlkP superfamily enzyme
MNVDSKTRPADFHCRMGKIDMKAAAADPAWSSKTWQGSWKDTRYGFAAFVLETMAFLWLGLRILLYIRFGRDTPLPVEDLLKTFAMGLARDVYFGLVLCLPMLGWFLLIGNRAFGRPWHRRFSWGVSFLYWFVTVFLMVAEYYFFEEFLSRFNRVAVDYLLYPNEVFINIWDSYPVAWVLAACGLFSAGWVWVARQRFLLMWDAPVSLTGRLAALVLAGGAIAGLGYALPLQGPTFSKERVINELANNGGLSFASAALTHHLDYTAFYRTLPLDEAYQRARRMLQQPGSEFTGPGRDIRRRIAGDPKRPKLNVVILLEESLGSEFWGSLGRPGPSLTPEMDRLANHEGLLFTNLYASGNRTVRGFEGVFSSFPPLPGDSIVVRHLSKNVESIARVLKRDGYQSLFLYGGRGVFDGMRGYAMENGWDRFIEQKHFVKPDFSTIWGVCDEEVFARAIVEFRELAKAGQPFLGTVLSVSNHKPYTYPKGRIPEDPEARKRDHAVKYSDYALGHFFKMARQEPFWTNTVFVVVADHGARVYGSQSIPIRSYEIPLLIAGPAVVSQPARLGPLGGSLDVAPTILGLIGRPYDSLFMGRDLLKSPPEGGRVPLNHNRNIGLFRNGRMVVLGLKKNVEFYAGDPKGGEIQPLKEPGPAEKELEQDCAALYQVADDLYMSRRYRIDAQ